MEEKHCPDCAADWSDGKTCTEHFHMMGFWELDDQLWDVHHLMVLAYNLQHPHIYSPEALLNAKQMLVDFLENDISPQQMREKIQKQVDSGARKYRVKGTADNHGKYDSPVVWSMTCADVIAAGIENYYASVEKWAQSVLQNLRESGNLKSSA